MTIITYNFNIMSTLLRQTSLLLNNCFRIHLRKRSPIYELLFCALIGLLLLGVSAGGNNEIGLFYRSMVVVNFSRFVIVSIVDEKETKQKEVQKIMGVSSSAYNSAWFLFMLLVGIYNMAAFYAFCSLLRVWNLNGQSYFLSYVLLFAASYSFSLFLSVFFSKVGTAGKFSIFIEIVISNLFWLVFSQSFRQSKALNYLVAVFPMSCYQLISVQAFGIIPAISIVQGQILLAAQIFFYLLLYAYLDAIIPNEYGTQKHPLFFLRGSSNVTEEQQSLLEYQSQPVICQSNQSTNQAILKVVNFSKNFNSFQAVKQLNLTIRDKELMCLLGHNGAGKSTTINALTGLVPKTSGKLYFRELDYDDSLDEIRKKLGICLQSDVLYDLLTAREQLSFYAEIKGITGLHLQEQLRSIIRQCGLQQHQSKLVKNLSGGNKRKLSLACAIAGGSSLLFLDQPTSGMDPESRRSIIQILSRIKKQKAIVLTTHHIEECEQLGDHIAILAKGKLLTEGSPQFVRKKFGIGYFVQISFNSAEQVGRMTQRVKQVMSKVCCQARLNKQCASNIVKFVIPQSEQANLAEIYESLCEELGVKVSIKCSTLEDAFIKIGLQDQGGQNSDIELSQQRQLQFPEELLQSAVLSFYSQTSSLLVKKFKGILRQLSVLFGYFSAMLYVFVGLIINHAAFQDDPANYATMLSLLTVFMTIGSTLTSVSYARESIVQREKKIRYGLNVMGMKIGSYWISNWVVDCAMSLCSNAILLIIVLAFKIQYIKQYLKEWQALGFLFMSSSILLSYLQSFLFNQSKSMYSWLNSMNLVLFYGMPILLDQYFNSPAATLLSMVYSPYFNFYRALNGLRTKQYFGESFLIFGGQILLYSLALYAIQTRRAKLADRMSLQSRQIQFQMGTDVANQSQRAKSSIAPIVVDNVSKKYYNGFVAVKKNGFVVQKKQILGLLGPNGAGKSTTFNILTASLSSTAGQVRLQNNRISKSNDNVFIEVGICPQFDIVVENLTVVQNLRLYGGVKGICQSSMRKIVEFFGQALHLKDYMQIRASDLSGGNKRKLCVAISLIGSQLKFLDEPSTGVDPISKKYLWRALTNCVRTSQSSIVLTTHSMTEAESLCSRIVILARGQIQCIGSPNQLKERYAGGFWVKLFLQGREDLKRERVLQFLRGNFKIESETIQQKFISLKIVDQNFPKIYRSIRQELLTASLIRDFTIRESSLEQVFLQISRMQPQVQSEQFREPWECCCVVWDSEGLRLG